MHALQAERRRRQSQGEEGFTLIELLIVLVILPLVVGAIAMVLITTLKNQQGIQGKVTDSAAAAASSEFYVRDVQSAGSVTTAATPTSAPKNCALVGATGTSKFLLGLQLQGTTTAGGANTDVAYYMVTPSQGSPLLVRDSCTVSSAGALTPLTHQILSDNLNTSDPPTPVVNCATPTPTSVPTGVTCNPLTNWTFTYMVSTVSLNVTQACTTSPCPPNQAPYQFALTGDPQSNVPVPPVVQPCGVLTLLGTNTDITFGAISSNLSVSAAGPIVIDSGYNTGNDPAIESGFFSSNTSVTATTNNTECPNTPAKDVMQVYDCNNTAANGGSANFQPCPTDSHNPVSQVSVSPSPVQTVAAPTDPLATWAAQNPVAAISSPTGSCTTSGTTITCNPGLYSSGLNMTSSRTYKFNAGNYQFGSNACGASLCVNNSDIVNFGSGHYTYTNGLNVGGSGSALCGGGPVTSACSAPPAGGVFFYVSGGSTALGNVNYANNIQLAPITATSDPYHGILLWQNGSDTNSVLLASAATSVNTYNGEIYVPNATISLYGFGNNITTGDVIANSINFGVFTFGFQFNIQ